MRYEHARRHHRRLRARHPFSVVACARVEGMARPLLAALVNLHEGMGQIAFSDRGHSWVLDALQDAVKMEVKDPALTQEWAEWIRDARRVNGRRNGIVHAQWLNPGAYGGDVLASARLTPQGRREGLSGRRRRMSLEFSSRRSLTALAAAADDLSRRLHALVLKTPGVLAS